MFKKLLTITVSGVMLMGAASAQAETLVRPRFGLSQTTYELGGDYLNGQSGYTAKNLGITFGFQDGNYLDLAYGTSGDASQDMWGNYAGGSGAFERTDLTLTLGNGPVYLGVKQGTSKIHVPEYAYFGFTEDRFDSFGFFVGFNGSKHLNDRSTLGLSGALLSMSSTWEDDAGGYVEADYGLGYSVGLSYSYAFSNQAGMKLDWKYQSYESTFDSWYTIDESINAFGLSLYADF